MTRLLILGGTSEASGLARQLAPLMNVVDVVDAVDVVDVVTSLAGRTTAPVLPPGRIRVGGFGGVQGLARYLVEERVDTVIDATHPFAANMQWNAYSACAQVGVRRLRLLRPGWTAQPGDRWSRVANLTEAGAELRASGAARVLLSTGRQELAPFAHLSPMWFLLRSIEAPVIPPGMQAEVVLARPPFTVESELELLRTHTIEVIVTKDSGAAATAAKLVAARQLGLSVVMVDRPPSPPGPMAADVEQAMRWLDE